MSLPIHSFLAQPYYPTAPTEALYNLLRVNPVRFVRFLSNILDSDEKEMRLDNLFDHDPEWQELLVPFLREIIQAELDLAEKRLLTQELVAILSEAQVISLCNRYLSNYTTDELAYFLFLAKDKEITRILFDGKSTEGFPAIRTLLSRFVWLTKENEELTPFSHIPHHLFRRRFRQLNEETKTYLLWTLLPLERYRFIRSQHVNHETVALWLDGVSHHDWDLEGLLNAFSSNIDESFVRILLERNSPLLPYLLLLENEEVFSNLFLMNQELAYQILQKSLPDDADQLLRELSLNVPRWDFLCNSLVMGPSLITFQQVCNEMRALPSFDLLQEDLHHIPPVLIALAHHLPPFQDWIAIAAPYLSEPQFFALIRTLPDDKSVSAFESKLRLDQLKSMLEAFSWNHLEEYLSQTASKLESAYKSFSAKKQQPESFQLVYELNAAVNEALSPQNKIIHAHSHSERISRCLTAFSKDAVMIRNRLIHLSKEVDLEEANPISDFYWSRLIQGVFPSIGVEHAGKLMERGIQSDRDFERLGITPAHQHALDKLCMQINRLVSDAPAVQQSLERKWGEFLHPRIVRGSDSFETVLQELVLLIRENFLPFNNLFEETDELMRPFEIESIDLCLETTHEGFKNQLADFLERTLIPHIKENDSLVKLQSYLTQTSLLR